MPWKSLYVDLDEDDRPVAAGCLWYPEAPGRSPATMVWKVPARDLVWSTQHLVSILLDIAHDGPGDYYETHPDDILPLSGQGSVDVEDY